MANVEKFRYWANKILPLVYDDSVSYYEFLGKVYEKLNETIDAVNSNTENVAEFDQRINDFIAAETLARTSWEDQQERDRQSWETIETANRAAWERQQTQKYQAFMDMFVDEYDQEDTYTAGDVCSYEGKMYVANDSTSGSFHPNKWDEIVLAEYLADYVQTAKAEMQSQYDGFLADYQRTFGIVNAFGTSTTDAINQNFFTINSLTLKGEYATKVSTNATDSTATPGLYTVSPTYAANMTNLPTDYNTEWYGYIWVINGSVRFAIQGVLWMHYGSWRRCTAIYTGSFGTNTDRTVTQDFFTKNAVTYKGEYATLVSTNATDNTATPGLYTVSAENAANMTNLPEHYNKTAIGWIWVITGLVRFAIQNHYMASYYGTWNELQAVSQDKEWSSKKWLAVGDSLTEINFRATANYVAYIKDQTGITATNAGMSGTGYMARQSEGRAFYQRCTNINTDYDVITIFGSGNDLAVSGFPLGDIDDSDTTTICGCINETIDTILSVYMTAEKVPQIGIIAPTPWQNTTPDITDNHMAQYVDKLKGICDRRSIPFLDLYHHSNLHPNDATFRSLAYSHDDGHGTHPDENGHKLIAPRFKGFLETLLM